MKLRRVFATFLALVLMIDASPFSMIRAAEAEQPDTVISAVNTEKLLLSATIKQNSEALGRTDQATIGADQPTIETLFADARNQFNQSGEEWNWFAYKVTAPADGTYTLGVETASSKYAAYQIPLCVDGEVYALQYTAKAQTVTAEVTFPAGAHTVVMFMPLPATKADITNNVWNDYHWCDVKSVKVDGGLTVSKPTAAEVEAVFAHHILSALDAQQILHSATINVNVAEDFVGRTDQATIGANQPTVETLYRDAVGQFNKAGEEWNWFAYKVTVPADGTYTLGVRTAGSKFNTYQIPLCVNGQVYALQCTQTAQSVTAEVTLPAGEHTVVMFMPLPATKADITNNVWNDYHWCNVRSVTVDGALTVSKPTAADVEAEFAPVIIPAVDTEKLLLSATIKKNANALGRPSANLLAEQVDQPTVESLYADAGGQFNKAGEEWNWFAYQVTAPVDGTYTLGVKTAGSKFDTYQIPLCVNGQVYALQYTAKTQTVTAEVTLPAGKHTVVMFMPMPASKDKVTNNAYNDYHWCDVASVSVDRTLTVSKPTEAEVEACFPAAYTRVEAENAEYVRYNNYNTPNESNAAASGGMLVGGAWTSTYKQTFEEVKNWLSFKGNAYVEYAVTAPADGDYDIRVAFLAGSNDKTIAKPYIAVVVNDETYQAQFAADWGQIDKVALTVSLKEGLNIIRCTSMTTDQPIYSVKGWINHDFLEVDPRLIPVKRSSCVTVEAEDSKYYAGLKVQAGAETEAASGSVLGSADLSYVKAQKLTLDQLTEDMLKQIPYFSLTVNAPQIGYYPIRVAMATDGRLPNGTVGMFVDGQLQTVKYTRTDKTTVGAMLETLVYLTAGEHVLVFTTPMPAAADPEANYSYYWANYDYVLLYDGLVPADAQKAPIPECDSPLYQQSVLFVGDSITHSANSWAAKIGTWYRMDWTNGGVNGATISDSKNRIIRHQLMANADRNYDYVIMQGGINDAMGEIPIGTVSDSFNVADFDKNTYLGGLETLFYYAYENFPGAKLGYIITYATPNSKFGGLTAGDDTKAYYEAAKKACEKWGISYIDLYSGSTADGRSYSFDILQVDTAAENFINNDAQEIHLSAAGYALICPYLAEWMETLTEKSSPIPAANSGKHIDANDGDKVLCGGFTAKCAYHEGNALAGLQDRVYTGMEADQATIELLPYAKDMLVGWAFASVAVEAAQDGAYTIGVEVAAKTACQLGMLVDGKVYTLAYTKQDGHYQFIEQTVSLTKGVHYITFTAAMPANDNALEGKAWDLYPWTNIAAVVVDEALQVLSKPALEAVTAKLQPYTPFYTRVEAENAEYVRYNNYNTPNEKNTAASGGMVVGGAWNSTFNQTFNELESWLNSKGNAYVEYAVTAPADGEYNIRVAFLAGSNDKTIAKPYIAVVVNDQTYQAQFTKNWGQIDKVALTVSLKEGLNIIRCTSMTTDQELYSVKGWINHDFLEVDTRLTPVKRGEPAIVEAENSKYFNKLKVQPGAEIENASGSVLGSADLKYVRSLKLTLDQITQSNLRQIPYVSFTVTAPQNGYYPICVAMAGDGRLKRCTVGMMVDGQMHEAQYVRTDKTTKGAMVEALVYLSAGDHVLTFTTPMPAAKDPEANYSYFWANFDYVMLYDGLTLAKTQKAPTWEPEYVRVEVEGNAMLNLNKNTGTAAGGAYYKSGQSTQQILKDGIDGGRTPYIRMTVQAAKAGTYLVYLGANIGMTEGSTVEQADVQMAVEVNGTVRMEWLHATKSTNYAVVPLKLELEAGKNVICLTHLTGDAHRGGTTWVDFDYIDMPTGAAQQLTWIAPGEILEAETSRYSGFAESTGNNYSGGRYLGRANYDTVAEVNITYDTLEPDNLSGLPYVTYRVFAEKAGTYTVAVGFAAGLTNYPKEEIQQGVTASFTAIVNGKSKQRVEFTLKSSSSVMARLITVELQEGENEITVTGTTSEYVVDRIPRKDDTYRLVWIDQDYLMLSGELSNMGQETDPFNIEDSGYDFAQLVPKERTETPEQPAEETKGASAVVWFLTGIGGVTVLFILILILKKRKKNKE